MEFDEKSISRNFSGRGRSWFCRDDDIQKAVSVHLATVLLERDSNGRGFYLLVITPLGDTKCRERVQSTWVGLRKP